MAEGGRVYVGTSGWHYEAWKGPFYPPGLRTEEMLGFYCRRFRTVEINNSFYRLPSAETFRQWRETVPGDFLFAVKGSRFITHMKKLKDPREPLELFLGRARELGEKLGPVLFQLPPRWRVNAARLADFLEALPSGYRYAFEFRDESWFTDEVYAVLREHGAAFCIYDLDRRLSPLAVTCGFVYVRLHGPNGPYQGSYDDEALSAWARRIRAWLAEGKDVYCYFDNDQYGYAALNALSLKSLVEDPPS